MCLHQIPTTSSKQRINVFPLQIKCWKLQGPHYAIDCKNKTNVFLCNLQEEPTVEDIASTPRIYAALDGQQVDHYATMV